MLIKKNKLNEHRVQQIVRQANYDSTISNFITAAWVGFTLVCCVLLPLDKVPKDTTWKVSEKKSP